MNLSRTSGDFINLEEAKDYVDCYRKKYPEELKGYFFGSDKLQQVIDQEGCIGLRIYNGYCKDEDRTNLVIVGVNNDGHDMTSGLILEKGIPCPSTCDPTSPLY